VGVQGPIYILCILKSYWISHLATLSLSVTWVLCVTFVNDMPNSEQCTMLFSVRGKGSMCIVRTRHINSVGYVLIFKWGFLVWQKLTGVLGFLWHFFVRSLQILVCSLWLEHNFLSCRRPTTLLGQFPGDPAGQGITCSGNHFLEMPDVPVSKIWPLWFYEYTSLPGEWDVISLSFFFFVFFQMPERVHKNVDWKQSPNLHSEAHSFLGSACQGESME
jgi:hypothetical protein